MLTNNEMKQSLIKQVIDQVPELLQDQMLKASFIIILQKALDAFEDGLKDKLNRYGHLE